MPLYEFKCLCGKHFDRFLAIVERNSLQFCSCGSPAERVVSPVPVRGDYQGYACPVTGKWIEGRKAHEENLKKHGCRVLEEGETREVSARKARNEERFLDRIAETAAAEVAAMPARKQEQLCNELSHGVDVSFERK